MNNVINLGGIMDIKNLILKNKSIAICLVIALGLGVIGGRSDMSKAEYNSSVEQKEQLDSEIVAVDKQLEEVQNEVTALQAKKDEADRLAKAEADRIAKVEAERLAQEEAARLAQEEADRLAQAEADRIAQEQQNTNNFVASGNGQTNAVAETPVGEMVWLSATGEKYHSINNCGKMNPNNARQVSLENAISSNHQACSKCY